MLRALVMLIEQTTVISSCHLPDFYYQSLPELTRPTVRISRTEVLYFEQHRNTVWLDFVPQCTVRYLWNVSSLITYLIHQTVNRSGQDSWTHSTSSIKMEIVSDRGVGWRIRVVASSLFHKINPEEPLNISVHLLREFLCTRTLRERDRNILPWQKYLSFVFMSLLLFRDVSLQCPYNSNPNQISAR